MIGIACSWIVTVAFVALHVRAHRRLVLVARACHELRGPLFAVQLGLVGLDGEPSRLAAIELELQRAGRALEDLTAAPAGGRAHTRRERVDLAELVETYAPAWRTLAAGYGAELSVEALAGAAADSPRPPRTTAAPDSRGRPPGSGAGAPGPTAVHADPLRIAQ